MWKELGADALEFLQSSAPSGVELPITQWSKILNPASLSDIELVQVRELANLAEKGDEKIWDRLQGKDVLLWAPSDNNALTRILAALLRRAGSDRTPTALRMIAPVPLLAGMNTVESISQISGGTHCSVRKGFHSLELFHFQPTHSKLFFLVQRAPDRTGQGLLFSTWLWSGSAPCQK